MPITQATCKFKHPALKGKFDEGDAVKIEPILSDRRITGGMTKQADGRIGPNIIVAIGDYIGFRIKSKDGRYYNDKEISAMIGYKHLSEIFTKN